MLHIHWLINLAACGHGDHHATTHAHILLSWLTAVVALQYAMLAFEDMAKLSRPGAVTECLSDDAITELVFALARTGRPEHLIRVLGALVDDGRPLPVQTLVPINVEGLSFVTSWVPAALENARTLQEVEGESLAGAAAQSFCPNHQALSQLLQLLLMPCSLKQLTNSWKL